MKKGQYIPAVFIAADGATQMIQLARPPYETYELELRYEERHRPKDVKTWPNKRHYKLVDFFYNPLNNEMVGLYQEILLKK